MEDALIDRVLLEWQIYRLDNEVVPFCNMYMKREIDKDGTEKVILQRIDEYWGNVLQLRDEHSGKLKYSNLAMLVKCCLCLAHGNADVERGFSINNALVTCGRPNLVEATILGVRAVKDAVHRYGGICAVPITGKLLNSVTTAHSAYAESKKLEQEAFEELKRKRILKEDQKQQENFAKKRKEDGNKEMARIDNVIISLQESLNAAQSVLAEGNERLKCGMKRKDFKDMRIASTLIDTATIKVQMLTKTLSEEHEKKEKLKSTL